MKKRIMMMPFSKFGPLYQYFLAKELKNEDVKVIFPEKLKLYPSFLPISRNILKYKINFIHMHWIDGFSGLSSKSKFKSILKFFLFKIDIFLAKYLLNTKFVWTIHNLHSHMNYYPTLEVISRRSFGKSVEKIICHCDYAKSEIKKRFGIPENKLSVINIGNYYEGYRNDIQGEKAREQLKIKNDEFIFLIFGPIRPYKGILGFIEKFREIEPNENVKLMIVGKPMNKNLTNNIIQKTKNNPRYILKFDFINEEDIQIYMNASNVVVFCYTEILTSAGILLAMSFGKPIIAPLLGCIPETLDDRGAFLYNAKKNNGLSDSIKKALESKERLEEMGRYNLELAKDFDWKVIANKTKEVYDSL